MELESFTRFVEESTMKRSVMDFGHRDVFTLPVRRGGEEWEATLRFLGRGVNTRLCEVMSPPWLRDSVRSIREGLRGARVRFTSEVPWELDGGDGPLGVTIYPATTFHLSKDGEFAGEHGDVCLLHCLDVGGVVNSETEEEEL